MISGEVRLGVGARKLADAGPEQLTPVAFDFVIGHAIVGASYGASKLHGASVTITEVSGGLHLATSYEPYAPRAFAEGGVAANLVSVSVPDPDPDAEPGDRLGESYTLLNAFAGAGAEFSVGTLSLGVLLRYNATVSSSDIDVDGAFVGAYAGIQF